MATLIVIPMAIPMPIPMAITIASPVDNPMAIGMHPKLSFICMAIPVAILVWLSLWLFGAPRTLTAIPIVIPMTIPKAVLMAMFLLFPSEFWWLSARLRSRELFL